MMPQRWLLRHFVGSKEGGRVLASKRKVNVVETHERPQNNYKAACGQVLAALTSCVSVDQSLSLFNSWFANLQN